MIFFNPVPVVPAEGVVPTRLVPANVFVPVALPTRFVPVAFVPAWSPGMNFLGASVVVPAQHCITTSSST